MATQLWAKEQSHLLLDKHNLHVHGVAASTVNGLVSPTYSCCIASDESLAQMLYIWLTLCQTLVQTSNDGSEDPSIYSALSLMPNTSHAFTISYKPHNADPLFLFYR